MLRPSAIRILVIESDEAYRRHLAERIRLEGFRVFEACREAEAQHLIEKNHIDVVLLGFAGDKQRGLALLRTIKRMEPCPEVILLTFADEHSLAASIEGMKLGAFDELLVPFNVDTLLRRIQEAWQHKREGRVARRGRKATKEGAGRSGEKPVRAAPRAEEKKQ